jgi:hypothetical protein
MLATAQDYAALIHMANFPSRANWYVKIAMRPRSPAAKQGAARSNRVTKNSITVTFDLAVAEALLAVRPTSARGSSGPTSRR